MIYFAITIEILIFYEFPILASFSLLGAHTFSRKFKLIRVTRVCAIHIIYS